MTSLRSKVIRLAHEKPELRGDLLPILKRADQSEVEAEASAEQLLIGQLQPLGKHGYWLPPYNVAVNFALMGVNLWTFTILPFSWKKKAYREDLNGIVIHPIWTSIESGSALGWKDMSGFSHLDVETVERLLSVIRQTPKIGDTLRIEFRAIEQQFGIQIPTGIESKIISEALKVAKRRWGVDRLRVKDRLIPLDGSKPYDLGSFD